MRGLHSLHVLADESRPTGTAEQIRYGVSLLCEMRLLLSATHSLIYTHTHSHCHCQMVDVQGQISTWLLFTHIRVSIFSFEVSRV